MEFRGMIPAARRVDRYARGVAKREHDAAARGINGIPAARRVEKRPMVGAAGIRHTASSLLLCHGRAWPHRYQNKRSLEEGLAIQAVPLPSWPGLSGPSVQALGP